MKIGIIGLARQPMPGLLPALTDSGLEVVAVSDASQARLAEAERLDPDIATTSSPLDLTRDPVIDAILLFAPSTDRFFLTEQALDAGKHVLVNGRLTQTAGEAEALASLARRRECSLMSGWPAIYEPALIAAGERIREEGPVRALTARRPAPAGRADRVDAFWDGIACNLALFDALLDDAPVWVSAVGTSSDDVTEVESINVTLQYRRGTIAQIELGAPGLADGGRVTIQAGGHHFVVAEGATNDQLSVDGEVESLTALNPQAELFRTFANNAEHPGTDLSRRGLTVAHCVDQVRASLRARGSVQQLELR